MFAQDLQAIRFGCIKSTEGTDRPPILVKGMQARFTARAGTGTGSGSSSGVHCWRFMNDDTAIGKIGLQRCGVLQERWELVPSGTTHRDRVGNCSLSRTKWTMKSLTMKSLIDHHGQQVLVQATGLVQRQQLRQWVAELVNSPTSDRPSAHRLTGSLNKQRIQDHATAASRLLQLSNNAAVRHQHNDNVAVNCCCQSSLVSCVKPLERHTLMASQRLLTQQQ